MKNDPSDLSRMLAERPKLETAEQFIKFLNKSIEDLRNFMQEWESLPGKETLDQTANIKDLPKRLKQLHPFFIFIKKLNLYIKTLIIGLGNSNTELISKTPWKITSHLTHNIGVEAFPKIKFINQLIGGEDISEDEKERFLRLSYLLQQLIWHLESIKGYIAPLLKDPPEAVPTQNSRLIDTIRAIVIGRIFFNAGIRIPGLTNGSPESPLASIIGSPEITTQIPESEIAEMIYTLVSNAHRIISLQDNPQDLRIECVAREIKIGDEEMIAIEVFNTGPLVDLNKLTKKMLALSDSDPFIQTLSLGLKRRLSAIRSNSRQARIEYSEDFLCLTGITLESGGTGIGLSDLKNQLEENGGAILLNNVYAPEEGFCATLLLPKNIASPKNKGKLRDCIRAVKEALQSGELFLEKLDFLEDKESQSA
jgi:hypothetical protein